MYFSNTSTEDGIIQEINRLCSTTDVTYSLKAKTARVNQALDAFETIAIGFDKNWTFDDTNNTGLPIGRTNLVSGQEDYPLDATYLTVKNVFVADSNGNYTEITQEVTPKNTLLLPTSNSGVPKFFRLAKGSILLSPIPDYSYTNGLKIEFNRTIPRFASTDTNVTPGIPPQFHWWLAYRAALPYCIEQALPQKNDIAAMVAKGEQDIRYFIANRNQTLMPRLRIRQQDNR